MKEPHQLEADKHRGLKAERLLKDPLLSEALQKMRNGLYKSIEDSTFKNIDEREEAYRMLKCIVLFETQFKNIINTGRAAEEKLSMAERVVKRIRGI